jgi:PPOX class probable F420-dependent enzyme
MATDQALSPLADEKYVNLETFRKNGTTVKTPVWAAPLDGKLVIFCDKESYKVKRIRNDPKLRAAACNVRGTVHGDWMEGTGRVVEDDAYIDRIEGALEAKYGLLMKMTSFFKRVFGKGRKGRSYLEVTIAPWSSKGGDAQAS